jgi:hypothetical protein
MMTWQLSVNNCPTSLTISLNQKFESHEFRGITQEKLEE